MKIRRYMANNMQEALLKVKMDLGADAVILNTRKVKRPGFLSFLRAPLIEILASLEEEENEKKNIEEIPNPKVDELENKVKSMELMLDKIYKQMSSNSFQNSVNNTESDEKDTGYSRIYKVFIDNMRQNDVEENIINEMRQL